ncbi:alpha-L-fucosidase [Luteimonas aquatica]|uniref:alpha-L-fucosidase n=1 Tax=Luteimonas aquatica TaxID=450364 RepID=UPI001F579DF3|nr:alpha-L-fucosidase [Luteimonas aquatica]
MSASHRNAPPAPQRRRFLAALGAGIALPACAVSAAAAPKRAAAAVDTAARPVPTPAQLAWQREELSMFVHFTVNTFTDREWGDGTESPQVFAPTRLDARQWARAASQAGFASMVLTAKHHDGFCLWPTATTAHSVAASPWREGRGDLVREFVEACRAEGLRTGVYLSPWDRNHPRYGSGQEYNDVYIAQLTELLTRYGPMTEVWFDGANGEGPGGRRQTYDWPRIHATVRRLQPNAVMFSDAGPDVRWVGNESGSAGAVNWSTVDPARVPAPGVNDPWTTEALQQGDPDGAVWRPAETDVSIRPGWFWHARESDRVRSADNLLELYFNSVGRNSKLLLNVPPNREGLFDAPDLAALAGFHARRTALFADDLLRRARVRASGGRDAAAVLDPDPDRHWQADARSGWLEFALPEPVQFDVVRLGEAIAHGQHVGAWRLQAHAGEDWRTVAWGSTLGHCRLARMAPVRAQRLRLMIDFAYDTPRIAQVSLFRGAAAFAPGKRADDHGDA